MLVSGMPGGRLAGAWSGEFEDLLALLRSNALLRHLSEAELREIVLANRIRRYEAGGVVFKKGAARTDLVIVLEGRVKLSSTSEAGHELLINIAARGHSFGEVALIDGAARSFDATALEDSALLVLARASLLPLIERNREFGFALMQGLCQRARRSEAMIQDAVFLGIGPRLARQLLRLAAGHGTGHDNGHDDAGRAELAISQQELANLIGVTRESVNKQLCAWRRAGIIAVRRGAITIEAAARLRRVCGEGETPPEPGPSPFRRRCGPIEPPNSARA
jgi:CRP-like cAMP-binding protein